MLFIKLILNGETISVDTPAKMPNSVSEIENIRADCIV